MHYTSGRVSDSLQQHKIRCPSHPQGYRWMLGSRHPLPRALGSLARRGGNSGYQRRASGRCLSGAGDIMNACVNGEARKAGRTLTQLMASRVRLISATGKLGGVDRAGEKFEQALRRIPLTNSGQCQASDRGMANRKTRTK